VVTAWDGAERLKVFEKNEKQPDLVITDLAILMRPFDLKDLNQSMDKLLVSRIDDKYDLKFKFSTGFVDIPNGSVRS
jgi:hypothetical protein